MSEPWVCFEDAHLLAVHKPSGVTTHRADDHAQDGMFDWVRRLRPEVRLSILHRLDKGTSGLLLFGKSPEANRALSAQFADRRVDKRYELLVPRDDQRRADLRCDDDVESGGAPRSAATDFSLMASGPSLQRFEARPHSGRTHQVRVHAAALGMPILGDADHGGAPAPRLCLHAASLGIEHPDGHTLDLSAERPASLDVLLSSHEPDAARLAASVAVEARTILFDPFDTDAHLCIDRHHDGFPGVRVERLGEVAFVVDHRHDPNPLPTAWVDAWSEALGAQAVYAQRRPSHGEGARLLRGSPREQLEVRELGLRYLVDLRASATSTGLFLDQRETRRELLAAPLAGASVLNVFAHTGSLSVAAAAAGATTLSIDLSRRYLEWARENLRLNGHDPNDHDTIYGDALDWMSRLAKKGRTFELVLVDPPSTSTPRRGSHRWSVARDLHALVEQAARLCSPGGRVYVSTNMGRLGWARFLDQIDQGLAAAGRSATVDTRTLPLDHRSGSGDPPYLKAAWIDLDR